MFSFQNTYNLLPLEFFERQMPTKVSAPQEVIINEALAKELGISLPLIDKAVFSGNEIPQGAEPLAQAYAGHQFGHFNMLGDGRAILLGEHITPQNQRFDIQLKGAGATKFSRNGDGRAALKPMLREYLISEAMHALNIPTTRSLAVFKTGEITYRETQLQGAVLTRIAKSHIRVGTFQYAAALQDFEALKALADYTIKRHYPNCLKTKNPYLSFLKAVINTQIELIVLWQSVGFIHGVMNTDNMSICGETIDYGPCAFMDVFNPATVFSSIDRQGRYAYGNQPSIAAWNLARFAETLLPLLDDSEEQAIKLASKEINAIQDKFSDVWLDKMRLKLGLLTKEEDDLNLIETLLEKMLMEGLDFTNSFQDLPQGNSEWHQEWQRRLERNGVSKEVAYETMQIHNPRYIPRNAYVEEALEAANNDDLAPFNQLLEAIQNPFLKKQKHEKFRTPQLNENYKTFCGT